MAYTFFNPLISYFYAKKLVAFISNKRFRSSAFCYQLTCFVCALLVGCGSSSELRVAIPSEAVADGLTAVNITAQAKFRGSPITDGTQVYFQTDQGSFGNPQSTQAQTEIAVNSQGGTAQATLYPPQKPGEGNITVSFTNVNNESIIKTEKIKFVVAPPAYAKSVNFSCATQNIGALLPDAPAITVNCALVLQDQHGNPLPAGVASFYQEAGQLFDDGPASDGTRHVHYTVVPNSPPPVDVDPLPMELSPSTLSAISLVTTDAAGTHNPRDGVATLLAVVNASEEFTDLNGNGVYDPGEPFVDEAEPCLDVDDDGTCDSTEFFIDVNHDGKWENGNGQYDSNIPIGRLTHVLWSGTPQFSSDSSAITIPAGGSSNFNAFLKDLNGNPPATFSNSDAVVFQFDSSPSGLLINGAQSIPLSASVLMSFSKSGKFLDFSRDINSALSLREFVFNFRDVRVDTSSQEMAQFMGSVSYTPARDVDAHTVYLNNIPVTVLAH